MAINLRNKMEYLVAMLICILFIVPVLADSNEQPQNAAMLYKPLVAKIEQNPDYNSKSPATATLKEYVDGRIPFNDSIRRYVADNSDSINIIQNGTEIVNCDWDLHYSKKMTLPHLETCRTLTYFILADARLCADTGKYKEALQKCLCAYKFGKQVVSPKNIVTYLVDTAIVILSFQNMQYVMNNMQQDIDTLKWLKQQLIEVDGRPEPSFTSCFLGDMEFVGSFISKEDLQEFGLNGEKLKNADKEFWAKNRSYWQKSLKETANAMQQPYPEAIAKMKKITDAIKQDTTDDSTLTKLLFPACDRMYSLSKKRETTINAIKNAVDIYIVKAQTGNLPDKLAANQLYDAYSDKPFLYEKLPDGFTLICRGKDLFRPDQSPMEFSFDCKK